MANMGRTEREGRRPGIAAISNVKTTRIDRWEGLRKPEILGSEV